MSNENIIMDSTEIVSWMLRIVLFFVGFYLGYRWVKKKREKGESLGGSKEEWIKAIITIAGIATIPMIILMIDFNLVLYALLFVPIWIIFVWIIFPKLKRIKSK
jgi:hypothetical protein